MSTPTEVEQAIVMRRKEIRDYFKISDTVDLLAGIEAVGNEELIERNRALSDWHEDHRQGRNTELAEKNYYMYTERVKEVERVIGMINQMKEAEELIERQRRAIPIFEELEDSFFDSMLSDETSEMMDEIKEVETFYETFQPTDFPEHVVERYKARCAKKESKTKERCLPQDEYSFNDEEDCNVQALRVRNNSNPIPASHVVNVQRMCVDTEGNVRITDMYRALYPFVMVFSFEDETRVFLMQIPGTAAAFVVSVSAMLARFNRVYRMNTFRTGGSIQIADADYSGELFPKNIHELMATFVLVNFMKNGTTGTITSSRELEIPAGPFFDYVYGMEYVVKEKKTGELMTFCAYRHKFPSSPLAYSASYHLMTRSSGALKLKM